LSILTIALTACSEMFQAYHLKHDSD